ncbi:putative polysaccharide biosynthesis protein [Paenibacillus jilunlii]|uniref:Membrane protein involved in the export of O-antigen and teichoic acid n=1 Tax=Paenibacillus jilunlii TaxID=682956 RepID=A0A1G9Z8B9_9BACL|nr:polysaccharide biosynthesis protein [Paenibacillus jilunlii]SDN17672.1 Membrane protein involved in the export of O-antigen and teichoic acid [Paenibacillus jilunlii]
MKLKSQGSKLLQGAFILSAAAILSKLIGTLQKIPLQNLGGDAVFGIYNTVYPLYTMLVTVAMLGLPSAVSKFVAEASAGRVEQEGRRVLKLSAILTASSGVLIGILVYAGAPLISVWVGNSHVTPALRSSAWGLAVVPLMAALRGYFQGLHNMVPTAVSQVAEQTVRVAVMIALLLYLTSIHADAAGIAAGALLGSAGGGVAGLLIMLLYLQRHRRQAELELAAASETAGVPSWTAEQRRLDSENRRERIRIRQLLAYGLPVMLGALAVPLIGLVDVFTVPRLLSTGGSEAAAMAQFGIYNRGLPLVQIVTMLATSLSVVFIPALAEAKYRGDLGLIQTRCSLSLRWFWLLGLAASAGLAVLAEPVNIALYGDASGSSTMVWLAFTAAGGTVSIISAALLQGLGAVRAPALHLLAAALLKAALNLLLVPQQGITGAAIASVAAHGFAAALNVLLLHRQGHLRLRLADALLRPALLLAGLALAAAAVSCGTGAAADAAGLGGSRTAALAQSLLGVLAGCAVFAIGAVALRLLSESELRQLPGFGPKLADKLKKLRLLP